MKTPIFIGVTSPIFSALVRIISLPYTCLAPDILSFG